MTGGEEVREKTAEDKYSVPSPNIKVTRNIAQYQLPVKYREGRQGELHFPTELESQDRCFVSVRMDLGGDERQGKHGGQSGRK